MFLVDHGKRSDNPCQKLKAPKQGLKLPKSISEGQIEALLNGPDLGSPHGMRDKAILEVMYATGMRVSEVVQLQLNQINLEVGVVQTVGKGNKERMVPLGEVASEYLAMYMGGARGILLSHQGCDFVFVSQKKNGMSRQLAWMIVKRSLRWRGLNSLARTCCGTLLPPTWSITGPIYAPCRCCWAMPTLPRPRFIPTWPKSDSKKYTKAIIQGLKWFVVSYRLGLRCCALGGLSLWARAGWLTPLPQGVT